MFEKKNVFVFLFFWDDLSHAMGPIFLVCVYVREGVRDRDVLSDKPITL